MDRVKMEFTAVFVRSSHGYVGFLEEMPEVVSHGHTLELARAMLEEVAAVVFDEARRESEELIDGAEVVREPFTLSVKHRPLAS